MTGLSTLCYIEKDGRYLMLHRTVKKNDVNKDKWIGVGGHLKRMKARRNVLCGSKGRDRIYADIVS